MSGLSVRPAGEADTPFLAEMLVLTLQTQPQFAGRNLEDLQTLAHFEMMGWQTGRDFAFVAWPGEARAGAVWLHAGGETAGKTYTVGLAVLPTYQGQGIGTRLMEYALEFCKEGRALSVDLKVHPTNEKALRLYRRFGFEPGMLEMKKRLQG
jgi:ribosomal protein S18 acetylase RimI-like enzyme